MHRTILLVFMRKLSEDYYCSGWMTGLEHYLWHMVEKKKTEEGQILEYLAEVAGGWWMWDDAMGGPIFVPLVAWKKAYDDSMVIEPV